MKKQIRLLFLGILGILIPTIPGMTQGSGGAFDPMEMPKFKTFVNDYAGVLSPDQLQDLNTHAQTIQDSYGAQIVTVLFPHRKGHELFDITLKAFNENGIGDKEKNDGVLLAIATEEKKIRIMVAYGMEEKMPDLLAKQVIERLIRPLVNHDKVYSGVSNFYQYIEPILTKDEQALQAAGINPKEYHELTIGNVKLGGFSYLEMALILGLGFGLPILFFRVLMQQIHTLLAKKEEIRKLHNGGKHKTKSPEFTDLLKQLRKKQRRTTGILLLTALLFLPILRAFPDRLSYRLLGILGGGATIWSNRKKKKINSGNWESGSESGWRGGGGGWSSGSSGRSSSGGFSGGGGRSGGGGAGD